jgi:hypothetical protein
MSFALARANAQSLDTVRHLMAPAPVVGYTRLMDRASLPRELRPFINDDGRLTQWPARRKVQGMAIAYLATKFEAGREYREREVNELLLEWHAFGDWALLRRLLFDWRYMDRESDGTRYRLRPPAPHPTPTSQPEHGQI